METTSLHGAGGQTDGSYLVREGKTGLQQGEGHVIVLLGRSVVRVDKHFTYPQLLGSSVPQVGDPRPHGEVVAGNEAVGGGDDEAAGEEAAAALHQVLILLVVTDSRFLQF